MWWLIALRALRRDEAAGLRWGDVDLDGQTVTINQQRLAYGRTVTVGPPKTVASRRTIALDRITVTVLRAHRRRQEKERALAGQVWKDTGYVFTTTDGEPLHPDYLTRRFRRLVEESGLPPVRLHDLRHGAASLAHSAGADLKTIQEQLGHTSIVLTADTYTSVLTDKHHKAAEATARLVLAAAAPRPEAAEAAHRRPADQVRCYRGHAAAGTRTSQAVPAAEGKEPASHPPGTHATPTVHKRQSRAMNAQLNGCATRDSNPEPAD
jgi:hypothetical protein